jgi:hypothetical protein
MAAGFDWRMANATVATLSLFFDALILVEDRTNESRSQLMHVDLTPFDSHHGAPISLYVGRAMMPWLDSKKDTEHYRKVERWMKNAFDCMWVDKVGQTDSLKVAIDEGYLDLECPGNACGLETDHRGEIDLERGYQLDPHNVSNTHQQLTLLIGAAGLYQEARREGF